MKIAKIFIFSVVFIFLTILFAGSVKADKCIDDCVDKSLKSGLYGKEYSNYFANCMKQCPQKKSSGPDGFCGVPWGATKQQIDNIMKEKGFSSLNSKIPGRPSYDGTFSDYPAAELHFDVRHNIFFAGYAEICPARPGYHPDCVLPCSEDMVKKFTEKYGQPSRIEKSLEINTFHIWENLQDASSSDNIAIRVWTRIPNSLNAGFVRIVYTNNRLSERLKQKDKDEI